MSTTVTKRGNIISSTWSSYITVTLNTAYSKTQVQAVVKVGIYYNKKHNHGTHYDKAIIQPYSATNNTKTSYTKSGTHNLAAGTYLQFGSRTIYWDKKTSSYTGKIVGAVAKAGGSDWSGESSVSYSFTVPAREHYAVNYVANKPSAATASVTGMPSNQTKYYGINLTLGSAPKLSGWKFTKWNTKANGTGTNYTAKSTYKGNAALTLYAQWSDQNPPSIDDLGDVEIGSYATSDGEAIKGFSTINISFKNAWWHWDGGKTLNSITMTIGSQTDTLYAADLDADKGGTLSVTPNASGKYPIKVTIKDSANATEDYIFDAVQIVDPTWTIDCNFTGATPEFNPNGVPLLVTFEIKNYSTTPESWDTVTVSNRATVTDSGWTVPFTFDENHVDDSTSLSPNVDVRTTYHHYDIEEKEYRKAFFATTRNQNYSNGIYNVMFVSGCDGFSSYTSRVWWSAINDPLYFPDTNYIEVGSNDTAIQGLTKVGDYLGVVKQSKTTDTAIFLVYPTSFEEMTTYAVKQGVQGVGALSKYAFNILGDETLFLSPNGVMAIVPSEDNEHKVQNRSYFIDGKLLEDLPLDKAYSFVYDGKYWLSVNDNCYVLDGNQRNSWGNDKTNLVYECYFLENVPAKCFAKCDDLLVFATDREICQFKQGTSDEDFTDAFEAGSEIIYVYTSQDVSQGVFEEDPTAWFIIGADGEYSRCDAGDSYDADETYYERTSEHEITNVPVCAEWSTVFDDDGAVHFYKTMQKKGNAVSILPTGYKYIVMDVDEDEWNENPTLYYTSDGYEYKQCKSGDTFDADETYYIRGISSTKVFVRKDENEPVEIKRSFNSSSPIPSEMYLNKKFKKYKRLQFILRNDADENFGVDSIVKNYTLGNYAKK